MPDFDLLIAGPDLVSQGRVFRGWLGIRDGRFAAVEPGAPPEGAQAAALVDASGLTVLPGLVDCHTHLREPGLEHKEDFATGTAAAAAGGVTTVLIMPFSRPPISTAKLLTERQALAQAKAVVDFGLQSVVGPANLSEVPALLQAGAISCEVLLADGPDGLTASDDAAILAAFEAIASVGGLAGAYCESHSLASALTARLQHSDRHDPPAHTLSRPPTGEASAVARAVLLARQAGVRLHLRQLSTRESVLLVHALKDLHGDLTAEVNPHHLFLTADELERQGPFARVNPPLRGQADVEALWAALHDGTLDLIATDHAPHARSEKEAGWESIWNAPPGLPGLETWLPLLLDAVAQGRLDLPQLARWCAEAPARRFGLAGRKGALAPGLDADLVLVDLAAQTELRNERLHTKAAYTPFHGRRLRGAIKATYLRGERVMHEHTVDPTPRGQFLRSEIT